MGWLSAAIGGALGLASGERRNRAQKKLADRQMDFQEEMSNSAVTRRMRDMEIAGINPILAARFDASTPPGAMAQLENPMTGATQGATTAIAAQKMDSEIELINNQAKQAAESARLQDAQRWLTEFQASLVNADIDYKHKLINKTIEEINVLKKDATINTIKAETIIQGLRAFLGGKQFNQMFPTLGE